MSNQTIEGAIELLKKTVKESAIPGQNHIDLTLIPAESRADYNTALAMIQKAIYDGELSEERFKQELNIP